MKKTRPQMIVDILEKNQGMKYTAKELAQMMIEQFPLEMGEKKKKSNYSDEQLLIQVTAEIGAGAINAAKKYCPNVATQDKPRPRLYYWDPNPETVLDPVQPEVNADPEKESEEIDLSAVVQSHSEQDLYPLLINFLSNEFGLYCLRIDEKTSRNSHGSGGNHWLHPDIVALEALDRTWDQAVRDCVRHGNDSSIRLWSFEVKKQLTKSNVRQSFFQAVSNSTWANFGYLVAAEMSNDVEAELQMLASLHGIGVLLLNVKSLFDSQILIPARERNNVDWQSVNRIVSENSDFRHFIEQVGIYSQTGKIVKSIWNK